MIKFSKTIILLTCLTLSQAHAKKGQQAFVEFGGGEMGGISFFLGGALCQLFSETKFTCNINASKNAYENMLNVQEGIFDMALVPASLVEQFFYKDPKNFSDKYIRAVANLGMMNFLAVVRKDSPIQSFADLSGKRVSIGVENQSVNFIFQHLIRHHQLDLKTIKTEFISYPHEEMKSLCNGKTDMILILDGYPSHYIDALQNSCPIRLVYPTDAAIKEFSKTRPTLHKVHIDGNQSYPDLNSGDTVGSHVMVIANVGVSTATVKLFLKQLKKYFKWFNMKHKSNEALAFWDRFKTLSIPLHEGVKEFLYDEKQYDILPKTHF